MSTAWKKNALITTGLFVMISVSPFVAKADCPPFPDNACPIIDSLFQPSGEPSPWYNQTPLEFSRKVLDPSNPNEIFGERYTYAQINWIINSLATILNPALSFRSTSDLLEFINLIRGVVSPTGKLPSPQEYAATGPAGILAGTMALLTSNLPVSAVEETKLIASRIFDIGTGVQTAQAQGFGYQGLSAGSAARTLWTASRNMAYLISVVLLIATGFMIMFKVKVNPQTVISLQVMIPKLIVTLILITFSFAIAGLVIDLIYVLILLFVGLISAPDLGIINAGSWGNLSEFLTRGGFASYFFAQFFSPFLASLFLGTAAMMLAGVFAPLGIPLLFLVIVFALYTFWVLIKILFMLLKAYATIMLLIAIAPFQIMLGVVPGQDGFGSWLRNLIANASVFVMVPILFVVQRIFMWDLSSSFFGINNLGATADLTLPFLAARGWQAQFMGMLIDILVGFTIFTMTPKIAEAVREALKVPAFKYGTGIGEAFGFGRGAYELFNRKDSGGRVTNDIFNLQLGELVSRFRSRNIPTPPAPGSR